MHSSRSDQDRFHEIVGRDTASGAPDLVPESCHGWNQDFGFEGDAVALRIEKRACRGLGVGEDLRQ